MARVHLTAVYDTRGAAETARDGLVDLGVDKSDTSIGGTREPVGTAETGDPSTDATGWLWGGFADFFVPDEDRAYYDESTRRGGFVVSARVDEALEARAREVLERSEPLNLEEEGQNWRRSGWPGAEPGQTVEVGGETPREPWRVRTYAER